MVSVRIARAVHVSAALARVGNSPRGRCQNSRIPNFVCGTRVAARVVSVCANAIAFLQPTEHLDAISLLRLRIVCYSQVCSPHPRFGNSHYSVHATSRLRGAVCLHSRADDGSRGFPETSALISSKLKVRLCACGSVDIRRYASSGGMPFL